MKCDFQISGNLPDKNLRQKCIEFLTAFAKIISDQPYRLIQPLGHQTPVVVVRKPEGTLFPVEQQYVQRYTSFIASKTSTHSDFSGIVFYDHFSVIFDNEVDGMLCAIKMETQNLKQGIWQATEFKTDDEYPFPQHIPENSRFLLTLGSTTRYGNGLAYQCVLAHALKEHFIPNLSIQADPVVDLYQEILFESGCVEKLRNVSIDALAIETKKAHRFVAALLSERIEAVACREAGRKYFGKPEN